MTTHTLYGLTPDQPILLNYKDANFLKTQTDFWRKRTRQAIVKCRLIEDELQASRFLMKRHYLGVELECEKKIAFTVFLVYRKIFHDLHTITV